jgi:hypothetical protein
VPQHQNFLKSLHPSLLNQNQAKNENIGQKYRFDDYSTQKNNQTIEFSMQQRMDGSYNPTNYSSNIGVD